MTVNQEIPLIFNFTNAGIYFFTNCENLKRSALQSSSMETALTVSKPSF